MENGGAALVGFVAGAAIGAGITWYLTKDHYEGTVVEVVNDRHPIENKKPEEAAPVPTSDKTDEDKKKMDLYKGILTRNSYSGFYEQKKAEVKVEPVQQEPSEEDHVNVPDGTPSEDTQIQIISPEEYGEEEDYECISLTLYKDGYLVDDDGTIVNDVEYHVGDEALSRIGEFEENSVYVRNDELKHFYDVLYVNENYTDVYGK